MADNSILVTENLCMDALHRSVQRFFTWKGVFMAEPKIKRENFISIQGWMLTDLKLKGNELIIYACIYGFTQAENQKFTGSLQYLSEWTNSTKQSIIKCLKSLVDKGLIAKNDTFFNGVKFCEYYATNVTDVLNKVEYPIKQSLPDGIKQSLPNNISSNNLLNTKDTKYIVAYLNEKAGTAYRTNGAATNRLINARLSEGYTLDDFKTVIDNKCAEWLGSDMAKYLRPETLFGSKFESYLNAPVVKRKTYGANGVEIKQSDDDELAGIL